MTAVAMNNLLNYIAGLNLSQRNRKWLAERIVNLPKKEKVVKDPTLMTKEEFLARVEEARKGEGSRMLPGEDLTHFLMRQGYDL